MTPTLKIKLQLVLKNGETSRTVMRRIRLADNSFEGVQKWVSHCLPPAVRPKEGGHSIPLQYVDTEGSLVVMDTEDEWRDYLDVFAGKEELELRVETPFSPKGVSVSADAEKPKSSSPVVVKKDEAIQAVKCGNCEFKTTGARAKFCCLKCSRKAGEHGPACKGVEFTPEAVSKEEELAEGAEVVKARAEARLAKAAEIAKAKAAKVAEIKKARAEAKKAEIKAKAAEMRSKSAKTEVVEEKPDETQPVEEKPEKTQQVEERPSPSPVEKKAEKTQPVEKKLEKTQPVKEKPSPSPAENKPEKTQPVEKKPSPGPVEKKLEKTQPVEEKPSPNPVEKKPEKTQPVEKKPEKTQPVEKKPEKTQPVEKKPEKTQPVEKKPEKTQPVEKKPEKTQPVEKKPSPSPVARESESKLTKPVEMKGCPAHLVLGVCGKSSVAIVQRKGVEPEKCGNCSFATTGVIPGFCCVRCSKTGGLHGPACKGVSVSKLGKEAGGDNKPSPVDKAEEKKPVGNGKGLFDIKGSPRVNGKEGHGAVSVVISVSGPGKKPGHVEKESEEAKGAEKKPTTPVEKKVSEETKPAEGKPNLREMRRAALEKALKGAIAGGALSVKRGAMMSKCRNCSFATTGVTPGFCCVACSKSGGSHGRACKKMTTCGLADKPKMMAKVIGGQSGKGMMFKLGAKGPSIQVVPAVKKSECETAQK